MKVGARYVAQGLLLVAAGSTSAVADNGAGEPVPSATATGWRAGLSLEFGVLNRPSGCPGYCQDAYGPALGVSAGRMVLPALAVVVEGWLFQRDAMALAAGVQQWLGGRGWVRGSLGGMSTRHHNADGGPGEGVGPALSVSGGVFLSCFEGVSSELLLRATAVTHEQGRVTSLTVGYGLDW